MAGGQRTKRPARLLLVGMMGSGKTTVGHLAAARLGWPHLDSDAEVEQATGQSVPEIFVNQGEPAFRAAETAALVRALGVEPVVVSVAGGAVLDPQNRQLIRESGTVVWLRADVETPVSYTHLDVYKRQARCPTVVLPDPIIPTSTSRAGRFVPPAPAITAPAAAPTGSHRAPA